MDLFAFDRYADFGYVFIRIIGDAVVDERDLAGKAADLQVMFLHKCFQSPVLLRRLQVMSAKTNADAGCFRKRKNRAVKAVGLVQKQKRPVVLVVLSCLEVLLGNAEADLSEEDDRLRLRRGELAGG